MVLFKRLIDLADRASLVVAIHNRLVDRSLGQTAPARTPLNQQVQFVLLVKALNAPRRIVRVIPHPMVVAVGVENDRTLAEHGLKAIGIKFRLLLPDARITPSPFRLDDRQRFPVIAPQNVVYIADALVVGHPRNLELTVTLLIQRPARLFQQQVDEIVASLGFGIVVIVGNRLGSLLR